MAGLCTSMERSRDMARGLVQYSYPPLRTSSITQCNSVSSMENVSNNIAEYEGLIAGLKAAAALGIKRLIIKGDS